MKETLYFTSTHHMNMKNLFNNIDKASEDLPGWIGNFVEAGLLNTHMRR